MRLHGSRDPQEPGPGTEGGGTCGSGAPNEVWSYGPEAQEILVANVRLRERLRPYLRELFREASETGAPLMRPMFWHAPDDAACRERSERADLRDLAPAVFADDVIDHFLAPVVAEVHVDIGHGYTLGV